MKDYNATRCLTALCLAGLLAACASAPKKPQPAPSAPPPPPPAPQTQTQPANPPPPEILPQAPQTYVVKKGDTLWGIASMYLQDPWRWPDIWYANPAIKNTRIALLGHGTPLRIPHPQSPRSARARRLPCLALPDGARRRRDA